MIKYTHTLQVVQQKAEQYFDYAVKVRRHLHEYPELSFQEFKTSEFIQKELEEIGIPYQVMGNTGVVALLKGKKASGKNIAFRADIDALPIQETEGRKYGSKNPGVMHACGHDAHTASLLGMARILNDLKDEFGGTVKFIFQPAEEQVPGGAKTLIKEGVLKNPEVDWVTGQHVMPSLEAGQVAFRSGVYMASADELQINIYGKGGHAAQPHQNIDPIAISAQVVTALQQVVSRMADPRIPTVLSWGSISGKGAHNVIPDKVEIVGTFRTFNEKWRAAALAKIKEVACSISEGMGATCELLVKPGYPVLENNSELTDKNKKWAVEYLGKENVKELDLWTASEDFAYYAQEKPACFYRLGTGNISKNITSAVHTSTFDIDEKALLVGIGLMSYLAIKQLQE